MNSPQEMLQAAKKMFLAALQHHPVLGVVYGVDKAAACAASDVVCALVANVGLLDLTKIAEQLHASRKSIIVNIDATPGLGQDRTGLNYLRNLGAIGVVSTRGHLMSQAKSIGLLAVQKVFITDRSNLRRILQGLQVARPTFVQAMPGPVISHLTADDIRVLSPYFVSGFVATAGEVKQALAHGAIGVSSQTENLWYRNSLGI